MAILFIVASGRSLNAQEPGEQWQFGWENESGLFVAYNPAGSVNPLLTIDPDFPPIGWRLTPDRALAIMSVQGITGLYLLMPDSVQQILPTQDVATLLSQVSTLAAWQEPYAVLVAEDGAFGTGLFVNFAENRVVPLTGEVLTPIDNWRFSADGQFLRYLSRADRDAQEWTLWERTLATGEERALHTLTSPFPIIHADRTGERWIYRTLQTDPRMLIHTVIFADGTSQILAQEPVSDPITSFTGYQLHLDGLLVFTAPCSADCLIEQRPLAGGSPKTYALSTIISPTVQPLAQLDENLLLALIENTYWLLNAAGEGVQFGSYSGVVFSDSAHSLISPDGQWLLSLGEAGTLQLWYLPTGALALENPAGQQVTVSYHSAGVLISQFEPRRTIYYRFYDGQATDLPHLGADFYLDVLSDGSLLYANSTPNATLGAGVYRYEPDSGSITLLVENLFPLLLK